MIADRTFSELVGRVYDCAMDRGRWPGVLAEICDHLDGTLADLSVWDVARGEMQLQEMHGWTPEAVALVRENVLINPAAPGMLSYPLGEPWVGSRDYGIAQLRRTLYWERVASKLGTADLLAVPMMRHATRTGFWAVTRTEPRGEFADDDLLFARLLTPHVRRAVEIAGLLDDRAAAQGTLREVLERLDAAALVVAPDGVVRFRNARAEAELRDGAFLREVGGRLLAAHPEVARLLDDLALAPGRTQSGHDVVATDRRGRRVHVTWARLDRVEDEAGAPVLLLLRPPEPELRTPLGVAARLYALTPAETQVLAQVLEGRSLEEAAAILGVTRSTTKTQLAAVFAKTGTHRQSELVALVLGLVPSVG